jgi:hypothetical protein
MTIHNHEEYGVKGWLSGTDLSQKLYDQIKEYPEGSCTFEMAPELIGEIVLNNPEIDQGNLNLSVEALKGYMNVPRLVRVPGSPKKKNTFKKIKQRRKKAIRKKNKKKMRKSK